MRPGHRDVKRARRHLQIPRRTDGCRARVAAPYAIVAQLLARACNRLDSARLQVNAAYQMVRSVGDVETFAVERESLRALKARLFERPVLRASLARADDVEQRAV